MAALDDILDAVPDLQALIASVGEAVTLTPQGVLRDPARPQDGYLPGYPIAVQAAVTSFRAGQIDGQIIREGDRMLTILAVDLAATVPKSSDRVTIGGIEHRVISVAQTRAGGAPVAFDLQVRS